MQCWQKTLIRTCSALIFCSARSDATFCEHKSNVAMQTQTALGLQESCSAGTPRAQLGLLAAFHTGGGYSKEKIFPQIHPHYPQSHICLFLITCSESHNLLSQLQVPSGALCTSLAGVVYSSVFTLEPEPTPTLLHLTHNRSRQMARLHCKKSCRWKPLKRTRLWQ